MPAFSFSLSCNSVISRIHSFVLAATSVAVSQLILNMQSLAANLDLDPKWLLNNAELSRVRWRKGSRDGELIVEVDVAEEDPDMELGVVLPGKRMSGLEQYAVSSAMSAETTSPTKEDEQQDEKKEAERREEELKAAQHAERVRRTRSGITTTQYGYYEDMPNLFYKGKGDTRP